MRYILLLFLFGCSQMVHAQYLVGLETKWADSFREWTLFAEAEENDGHLQLRWLGQDDWTEWDYRVEDSFGQIKQKWKDNPNEWELRGNNNIVSMRTSLIGNFREWRISDNQHTLTFQTRYGNMADEWEMRNKELGYFGMLTEYEGDPRSWIITDELQEELSFELKMAMIFIAIYQSTPKQ
ncbi:MAG: hypothetical protein MRY78_01730 [Saprospiraceae bacterium]|nr:hypothetical protein [Saprospiraceae bacterium]